MGRGEDAAQAELAKEITGRLNAVASASQTYIHDGKGRHLFPCHRQGFLGGGCNAGHSKAGIEQRGFGLHGDEKIVFDDQDRVGLINTIARFVGGGRHLFIRRMIGRSG
ncbi:hypothetical protein MA20_32800 [Bradyrhizobium japonicum]|uniref:Uncharacterized protein n=1 Tax=Bradyrhizobium japonicum TaxID=375 RepID=A0A0A3YNM6_BRAJP|nr:hypothetical protein RN69_15270 [Bradyrhizobium japonicum]KGT75293.1 hypothetical protein MA20_32800 [Bradyrhizobium japonicum]